MSLDYNEKNITLARNLRKNATPQENHLWYDFLSKYEIRFQRQKAIDNFIADFYCHKAKLIIEIDGSQHYTEEVSTNLKSRRLLPPLSRSPSLSEGGFYCGIYILADTPKVCVDLSVCKPYDFQVISFKDFGSKFILLSAFFGIML